MKKRSTTNKSRAAPAGLTQLTLVEHALCPLDAKSSLQAGFCHETAYRFTDAAGGRQTSRVRVTCPDGLSASDEFYLWGLLALTFAQTDATPEFHASPHYCLSHMGVVAPGSKGGKTYRLFRESLSRLSGVRYENDRFYDPIRKEHRRVRFGLLGYSLPLDERSNRAWRIVWDAQFFEFCRATGGALRFDLDLYRRLDPASRRLFLLLQKVFYRRKVSPRFGVRELTIGTLGFSESLPTHKLRAKLQRCSNVLLDVGVLAGPGKVASRGDGGFVQFQRGGWFDRPMTTRGSVNSPLAEQLSRLGFDDRNTRWVLRQFPQRLVSLWCDVTQAAVEQKGTEFFRRNPAAFLIDNLKAAQRGERTPPDWFLESQKTELRRQSAAHRAARGDKGSLTRALDPSRSAREIAESFVQRGRVGETQE